MRLITDASVAGALPDLDPNANKYTRGVCELVVGSASFPGAAVLAAMAASRAGAGYVKTYTCVSAAQALHVAQPSVVCVPPADYVHEFHACDECRPRAAVVGCGMTNDESDAALTLDVLRYAAAPVLVDGGGLSALAGKGAAAILATRFSEGFPTVITPHGGEACRLAGMIPNEGREGIDVSSLTPAGMAMLLARAYGAVCVLKGPDTYIADGDEESEDDVFVLTSGTPALAKAGTGDVLAGCIGSLLAQGVSAVDAASLGVFVHARAGVLASECVGALCVTAEDVIRFLPAALMELVGLKEGR